MCCWDNYVLVNGSADNTGVCWDTNVSYTLNTSKLIAKTKKVVWKTQNIGCEVVYKDNVLYSEISHESILAHDAKV
jgi:hypothetical protein